MFKMEAAKTPISIYAEGTPNPSSMKFVANQILVDGKIREYSGPMEASDSPLAKMLFKFPFVNSVFISGNYITVTKSDAVEWSDVALELRETIQTFLNDGNKAVNPTEPSAASSGKNEKTQMNSSPQLSDDHVIPSPIDQQIIDVLNEYIKPAVEQDGGAIQFKSYRDGLVTVLLRGACSGCPSSTYTLKSGIETVLQRLIPEVKEVVAENQ